jgi:hypothetical protein
VCSTLVDLPGLIHSSNKSQSDEDIELIKTLVNEYISEGRTIILAVISAKNDYANQIILKICRKFDPKGARTLGVITKPDYLKPGSENELLWLDLAQNKDIHFELGWHLLKNRADDEQHLSFAQRNAKEHIFFNTGNYKAHPQYMKGIDALRQRLSKLLFDHLKRELPTLKSELDEMTKITHEELEALGRSRSTLADQRVYLTELFTTTWNLISMGINGNYENSFFGNVDTKVPIDKGRNAYRLRAVVQFLNMRFADQMRQNGHKYQIESRKRAPSDTISENDSDSIASDITENRLFTTTRKLSREESIEWVIQIMERSRGRELIGTFNPLIITQLFWDQSEPWEALARNHVNTVADVCKNFVLHVLDLTAATEVRAKLLTLTVLPALKRAHEAAIIELKLIIEDKKRHPITYNHYFTDTLQKLQQERYSNKMMKLSEEATVSVAEKTFIGGPGYENKTYIKPELFKKGLQSIIEPDMNRFSAKQALDAHDAYYKVKC